MAQQTFNDGDSGLVVRTILNDNATDAESRLTSLENQGDAGYLGVYADTTALNTAHPPATTTAGSTATVTSPNGNLFFLDSGGPSWVDTGTGFLGDMLKAVYDPTNKSVTAFSMGNMDETATAKVLTDVERNKLAGLTQGDVTEFSQYNAGTTSGPSTIATTPASAPVLDEMTHTFTPTDASNRIDAIFSGTFENDEKKGESISCGIFIDGTLETETERQAFTPGDDEQVAITTFWSGTLPASSTTMDVRYWGSDGTTTATGILRNFKITEIDEGG